ncbi:MAG: hypothetical protein J7M11_06740 [Elusimicrobia bacterium]|nr:hypothetical protein [Elusimicrobiota bacterium]
MKNKLFAALAVISVFAVTSCDNKNLFGKFHKAGSSSSIEVLLSDAESALANDDPAEAKAIADKIIAKDPTNSEALYISAAAGLKEAGLDLASIITSVVASTSTLGTDLIPDNINLADLAAATANAVEKLKKIADGQADGTIPQDDVDVNLNLGICQVLNAATMIFDLDGDGLFGDDDSDEPITLTSDFEVTIDTTVLDNLANSISSTTAQAQVKEVMILLVGENVAMELTGGATVANPAGGCLDYLDNALGAIDLGLDNNTIDELKINVDELTGDTTSASNNTVFDIWDLLQ